MTKETCPNHEGAYDCTPFCELCQGEQEFNPEELVACIACKQAMIEKWVAVEELGFCLDCSHAYWDQKLDPYTLEKIGEN